MFVGIRIQLDCDFTSDEHDAATELVRAFDKCQATPYALAVIESFRHKGLELFFQTGKKGGIQPHHAVKLQLILTVLNRARGAADLNGPALFLPPGASASMAWVIGRVAPTATKV